MSIWTIPFPVGYMAWNIRCGDCREQVNVRAPSLLRRWIGRAPARCVFYGSENVTVENEDAWKNSAQAVEVQK